MSSCREGWNFHNQLSISEHTRSVYLLRTSAAIYPHPSGPPSAPTDLNITTYNDTATKLAWGPPRDAQSSPLLSYAVVISNGSGALVYNETVREPQLVITTPDPCDHYEATVTPMCGGAQTNPVKLGGEGKRTAIFNIL